MAKQYRLTVLDKDGKEQVIPWKEERDPTDAEIDAILISDSSKNSKPGFMRGIADNFIEAGKMIVEPGKKAGERIRAGNYKEAFTGAIEDITAPTRAPFEGLANIAAGHRPSVTESLDTLGIPASLMKKTYEEGNIPRLLGQGVSTAALAYLGRPRISRTSTRTPTITPPEPTVTPTITTPVVPPKGLTPVEGMKSGIPKSRIDDTIQQELPLEFADTSQQPSLNYTDQSAFMTGKSTTPARAAFEGLVPERYKTTRTPEFDDVIRPQQRELFQAEPQMDLTPPQLEPRIIPQNRTPWASVAEQRRLFDDVEGIQVAEQSGIPEVVKAAKQVVESTVANPKISSWKQAYLNKIGADKPKAFSFNRVKEDMLKSNYAVLVSDSPAGRGIANLLDKYRTETGYISGQISAKIKDAVEPLESSQYTEFQQLVDKGGWSSDPMVNVSLAVVRDIDTKFTQRVTQSGLHLKNKKGELIPFTGKDNYWPRMYDHSLFANKPQLIERLIKTGMSPEAASKAVNNMRRFGERLIDPQNARVLDLPEHRKDLGALLKHYDDMAHRIASAEILGVKDIADPNTSISQLVSQTKDPSRITKILTQYLDRDTGAQAHEADFVKKVSRVTTAFYLSKFAISNTNQLAFVPIITNFKSTGKALRQFAKNPKNTWREAEALGAEQTVMQEAMRDAGGESLVSKAFLIKASEGSNRAISAIAGKHYVQDLFVSLKKNPSHARIRRSLEELTLENADVLLKQDTLSQKQIAYGATRVAEKTQGRAQSIDLPYNWDRNPYINLLLLYKKYAFMQGRLVKDAIKTNPARNIPLLLALTNVAGEVTGDAKALIKGSISGEGMQEVENRSEGMFDNKMINRVVQNWNDAMFLGLLGDAIESAGYGSKGILQFGFGPVVSMGADTISNVVSDVKNPPKKFKKSRTLQGFASKTPYIGSAVNKEMKSKYR